MKKIKLTQLILLALTIYSINLAKSYASEYETLKGFRLPEKNITKDYTLMSKTPSTFTIETYILKSNIKIGSKDREEIARNILKVSECFKIDPWILTGLIKKESTFNRFAVSPTKASGLTQFTGVGIAEVNDQLGIRGEQGAPLSSIEYFNTQIKECINPTFKHLWDRIAVKNEDKLFNGMAKKEIMNDIELAIIYGGVLLKTYLAYTDLKSDAQLSQIYFLALQTYNGEPGIAKVNYAKAIFKNLESLYPSKTNFKF